MSLKLMYITNRPEVAVIAEQYGVDRIFVDMEYIGKADRQKGNDSLINYHTLEDVKTIRAAVKKAGFLVRINPIHDPLEDYPGSEEEIEAVIEAGADIVMLPYFKTLEEVKRFLKAVDGRKRTSLLLETKEAADILDDILRIDGIDEIHIGLNDLSMSMGKTFLFEVLTDGTVEKLCRKLKAAGMVYGFGGVARPGHGIVPAEMIVREHYRLGSSMVILSRAFCDLKTIGNDLQTAREIFEHGVPEIRALEKECEDYLKKEGKEHNRYFELNQKELAGAVCSAVKTIGGEI